MKKLSEDTALPHTALLLQLMRSALPGKTNSGQKENRAKSYFVSISTILDFSFHENFIYLDNSY